MGEKSTTVAMIWSFLFTGIGLVYLGNKSKGLMIFGIGVLFNILGMLIFGFFHYLSILTWILGMYITYNDSKKIVREPVRNQYSRRVRRPNLNNNRHYQDRRSYHNRAYYQDDGYYRDNSIHYQGNSDHYRGNNIQYQGNDGYYGNDNRYYGDDERYYPGNNRHYHDDERYYGDDDRYW